MLSERLRDAHQRAAGADTGDEAVELLTDLSDQLGPVSVGGRARCVVLSNVERRHHRPRRRVRTKAPTAPFMASAPRGEDHLTAEPADHQHSLAAHGLRHVRAEPHADGRADDAQRDRGRPARRLDDDGGRAPHPSRWRARRCSSPSGPGAPARAAGSRASARACSPSGRPRSGWWGVEGEPQQPGRSLAEPRWTRPMPSRVPCSPAPLAELYRVRVRSAEIRAGVSVPARR